MPAASSGTKLVGAIPYLRTGHRRLYLATVIDLAKRMVVGWRIVGRTPTSLLIDALEVTRMHGHAQPGAIFHSSRGAQYGFNGLATYCARIGVRRNMGCTGVC